MFDFLFKKKNQEKAFNPKGAITTLSGLSPPSTLVYLPKPGKEDEEPDDLGKAFFLRRDKKLYTDGNNLYITSPDNVKGSTINNKVVKLQFSHRRVPHRMEARVVGRFRLLPEIVETLDFNAKSAYKLQPTTIVSKQEKRQYYRYTTENYGDSKIPLTTHITFDAFVKSTNHEFVKEGAPPIMIEDLQPNPYIETSNDHPFTTREGINEFRELMLRKQPHDRHVSITKVIKDDSSSMVKQPDEELLLGDINILGLDMESVRDIVYLKKSQKAAIKKGQKNPYNLEEGEVIIARFSHDKTQYEMICEVVEARTQNDAVRPIEFVRKENGLDLKLVDYSIGGILIESNPNFLNLALGDKCPPNVEDEVDFQGDFWERAFEELQTPILHLTFYPSKNFPDNVKKFEPELPSKFSILGQVVRTNIVETPDGTILQHGIQFTYDPQGIPIELDEIVNWRYTRHMKDNIHLRDTHIHLSQLIGHLENRSKDIDRSRTAPPS